MGDNGFDTGDDADDDEDDEDDVDEGDDADDDNNDGNVHEEIGFDNGIAGEGVESSKGKS